MCNSVARQERVCRAQRPAAKIDAIATSASGRDRTSAFEPAETPANCGLFLRDRETSVRIGLRGGAGRTQTSNQTVMSWKDSNLNQAVMSEPLRLRKRVIFPPTGRKDSKYLPGIDHELVDLDRRETGDRDIETFHDQDLSQGRQLDCQTLAIPASTFGNSIVSKSEGAPLGLRQPPHLDRGDLLEIEQSGRGIAAMAGNDDAVIVDQNRNDKSECGDAVGNLTDLLARMGARVTTVRRELVDRSPADINYEFLNGRQGERVRADLRRYRPICLGSSGSDHIHADRIALLLVLTAL